MRKEVISAFVVLIVLTVVSFGFLWIGMNLNLEKINLSPSNSIYTCKDFYVTNPHALPCNPNACDPSYSYIYCDNSTDTDWYEICAKVYSTECSASPSCNSGDVIVGCDYEEIGCSSETICGNSNCEEYAGENRINCPEDCDLARPPYNPGSYKTLVHNGTSRTYKLYVPECYNATALPLVLGFHGGAGTGEAFERQSNLSEKAEEKCFIVAYPDGVSAVGIPGIQQHWNPGPREADWYAAIEYINDTDFVSKLIDEINNSYLINESKIYATGISNGAMMSYKLACDLSEKITAIAPIGGGMVVENCSPKRAVPIIHFHGISDVFYPYAGGMGCAVSDDFSPVQDTIQNWTELNGCNDNISETYGNGEVVCTTYGSCNDSVEVVLCNITNGGHVVPGGYSYPIEKFSGVGKITRDINAADYALNFFERFSIGMVCEGDGCGVEDNPNDGDDDNDGGNNGGEILSSNISNSVPECVPNWNCGDWDECVEGFETRSCTDLNSCNSSLNRPAETRECELEINVEDEESKPSRIIQDLPKAISKRQGLAIIFVIIFLFVILIVLRKMKKTAAKKELLESSIK